MTSMTSSKKHLKALKRKAKLKKRVKINKHFKEIQVVRRNYDKWLGSYTEVIPWYIKIINRIKSYANKTRRGSKTG